MISGLEMPLRGQPILEDAPYGFCAVWRIGLRHAPFIKGGQCIARRADFYRLAIYAWPAS